MTTVAAGTKLGPYDIVGALGVGGMGEVYRARDTKLGREVALKVLPAAFAGDAERMGRFQREAKVLASLNHPNIASIYGFEDSGSRHALVMELVEGPTLADRIKTGAIPLDEALPIAKQIAEGLEYAHERGIVHRDLKPANIKLTANDAVKILDFGLAKALEGDPGQVDISSSPTISRMATQAGIILGTAAYMSPEQAKGKAVDRRADIWAFGCVLFEMLAGKMAFSGETVTDILAAVVRAEPDWSHLPAETPLAIRNLLARCLKKDSKQRLRDIGEARIVIQETVNGESDVGAGLRPTPTEAVGHKLPRHRAIPWATAGVALLTAGIVSIAAYTRSPQATSAAVVSEITPPANLNFAFTDLNGVVPSLSPDGRELAFAASGKDGSQRIYVRPLDSSVARPLDGTEDGISPFWSPDGRYLAFYAHGKLRKIDVTSGPPLDMCNAPPGRGGSWAPDGTILLAPFAGGISRVSAEGGTPRPVTHLDTSKGETSHRWPQFLPDGRHFLFYVVANSPENSGTYVGSIDGGEPKLLMPGASNAIYAAPGYLLFARGGDLMAQKFDAQRLELDGSPVVIGRGVTVVPTNYRTIVSASDNGLLVFWTGATAASVWPVVWFNRSGKEGTTINDTHLNASPRLSPSGRLLAVSVGNSRTNSDIWIYDLSRGVGTRLTFNPAPDWAPVWSPDGSRIAFASSRTGYADIYIKAANGAGTARVLLGGKGDDIPLSWSPDGRYLAYGRFDAKKGGHDIWMLPMFGDRKPFAFRQGPFDEYEAVFSPNGKWLAYSSDESGRYEVYVVPFPEGGGKWQVSTNGGRQPEWRHDGKELFYMAGDNELTAVAVRERQGLLQIGVPRPLFQANVPQGGTRDYDVAPDGNEFVMITYPTSHGSQPVRLVVNWPTLLEKHP